MEYGAGAAHLLSCYLYCHTRQGKYMNEYGKYMS